MRRSFLHVKSYIKAAINNIFVTAYEIKMTKNVTNVKGVSRSDQHTDILILQLSPFFFTLISPIYSEYGQAVIS